MLVKGKLVAFKCPVKKIVYTSKDPQNLKVVVIFEGRHSHPPWPAEKPTQEAKDDLKKCLDVYGIIGATGGRLDNGKSHSELLGSILQLTLCDISSFNSCDSGNIIEWKT